MWWKRQWVHSESPNYNYLFKKKKVKKKEKSASVGDFYTVLSHSPEDGTEKGGKHYINNYLQTENEDSV